jgi:hypothetical protein
MSAMSRTRVFAAVLAAFGAAFGAASCGDLFDSPLQCRYERDCARFGMATCDLATGVCVPRAEADAAPQEEVATDAGLDTGEPLEDAALDAEAGPPLPGPIARYTFMEGEGATVTDSIAPPLNLTIGTVEGGGEATAWEADGLVVTGPALVRTAGPATKIIDAVAASSELTVEAWVSPGNIEQAGPARIVDIATGTAANPTFMLGQAGATFALRTTTGGLRPELQGGTVTAAAVTHVVATRSKDGTRRLLVDGAVAASDVHPGALETIAEGPLSMANEGGGLRPWVGKLLAISIFDRAMTPAEVSARFTAGPK